jgi:signal peptidase I
MVLHRRVIRFLLPRLTAGFLIRVFCVGFSAYLFFGYLCIPIRIKGSSMEPTYHDGAFNFCWVPSYLFRAPGRHDMVAVRFAGRRVMLLKRVVALEGERVEFVGGKLLVDGKLIAESYVRYPCRWNLPPRQVEKGSVYVVGDNRDMPIEQHYFGQASVGRIVGAPLW